MSIAPFSSVSSSSADSTVCRVTPAETKAQTKPQLEEKIDRENKTSADDAYTAKIKASIEAAKVIGGETLIKTVVAALQDTNCKFTSFYLSGNKMWDAATKAIAEALIKNPNSNLTSIDLSSNNIGNAGAKDLAEALKHLNCKLTLIELWSNAIGGTGTIAIAEALQDPNCKLIKINLGNNKSGDTGTIAIAEALIKNPNSKLTEINLRNNNIGNTGTIAIAKASKNSNCKLTKIDLSWNKIGDTEVVAIAEALKDPNCKFTIICLWGNNIGDAGAKALAQAVVFCRQHGRNVEVLGIDNFENFIAEAEKEEKEREEKLKAQSERQELKDAKDEKKTTGPSLLQTLTPALQPLAALTSSSSVAIAPKDPVATRFDELLSKHQEFQSFDARLRAQVLTWINASYRTQQPLLRESKSSIVLEQLINECINSAISKVKQYNDLDVKDEKTSAVTVQATSIQVAAVKPAVAKTQPVVTVITHQEDEKAAKLQQQSVANATVQAVSSTQSDAKDEKKVEKEKEEETKAPESTSTTMMQFFLQSAQSFSAVAQNVVGTNAEYIRSFFASESSNNVNADTSASANISASASVSVSQEPKKIIETRETKEIRKAEEATTTKTTKVQSSAVPLSLSEQEIKTEELLKKAITEKINTVTEQIDSLKQEIAKQTVLVNQTKKGLATTNTNVADIATTQVTQTIKLEEQKQLLQQQQDKLHQLEQYAKAKESFNTERNQLLNDSNPAIPSFYNYFRRYFCAHLQTFFLAQTGIFEQKLGAVSDLKDESNLRSVASKVGTVTLKLLAVDVSAIPIIGTIMSPITAGAKLGIKSRDNSALTTVNSKFLDFMPSTFEDLAHVLAKEVIATYREQIELLTPESARRFAECGVIKIISALFYDEQIKEETFIKDALAMLRAMEVSQRQVSLCGFTIGVRFMNQPLDTQARLPDDFVPTDEILYRQTGLYIAGATPRENKYYSNDKRSYDPEAHERPPKPKHPETFASYIGYIKTAKEPLDTMVLDPCNLKVKRAEDARRAQDKQSEQGKQDKQDKQENQEKQTEKEKKEERGDPPAITAVSTSSIAVDQSPSIVAPLAATDLVTEASATSAASAATSTIAIPTSTPMPTSTSINTTANSSVAATITTTAATITSEPPSITTATSAVSSAALAASVAVPERSMVAPLPTTSFVTTTLAAEDHAIVANRVTLLEQENKTLKEKVAALESGQLSMQVQIESMQKFIVQAAAKSWQLYAKTNGNVVAHVIPELAVSIGAVPQVQPVNEASSSVSTSSPATVANSNISSTATNFQEITPPDSTASSAKPSTLSKMVPGGCILS